MECGKIGAFPRLNSFMEDEEPEILSTLKHVFLQHMSNLQEHLGRYFQENVSRFSWIRNPFDVRRVVSCKAVRGKSTSLYKKCGVYTNVTISRNGYVHDSLHFSHLFVSLFFYFSLQVGLSHFCVEQKRERSLLANEALKMIIPFPTSYLCEVGFSALAIIKTKQRNRLIPEHDLRCALTRKIPYFEKICDAIQSQPSH
jgi:hypothetical protein